MNVFIKYASDFESYLDTFSKEAKLSKAVGKQVGKASEAAAESLVNTLGYVGSKAWKHKKGLALLAAGGYLGNKASKKTRERFGTLQGQDNYPIFIP